MTQRHRFDVQWTDAAALDLSSIIDYLAQHDLDAATRVLQALRLKADSLYHLPERGRVVPELQAQNVRLYRELLHKSWRIIYRIEGARVYVTAVLDDRRNVEDLLLNRLLR